MAKVRHVCFTLHDYVGDEVAKLREWSQVSYGIVGREVCPDTGRPHLQGYIEFKQQVLLSTLKNKISQKIHVEERRGTAQQASKYCEKEDDYDEWGDISEQGRRTDLDIVTAEIVGGARMRTVARSHPEAYVKFHKGLRSLQATLIEPRDEVPTVTVLYGDTGVGKSRHARELTDDRYVWGPEQDKWFDGYEGQKDVIFEEFRGQLPFGQMLRMLDRYDCKVQYKGGLCEFAATNIVITSPVHPREWYTNLTADEGKMDQLLRRITTIKHVVALDR